MERNVGADTVYEDNRKGAFFSPQTVANPPGIMAEFI